MKTTDLKSPQPIASALRPVPDLLPALLPEALSGIVFDGARRIGCQPDYLYISVLGNLMSLLSPLVRVIPKQHDESWKVSVNTAGLAVGNSSSKKSAGMDYITDIVKGFCKEQALDYIHVVDSATWQAVLKHAARMGDGLVLIRADEISGFLETIDASGQEGAQSFYLTGVDGNGSYQSARASVEEYHVDRLQIAILGGIQPDKLTKIMHKMIEKNGNTGFFGRFLLLVYPLQVERGMGEDRMECPIAKSKFVNVLKYIANLQKGAEVHFSSCAQRVFNDWGNSRVRSLDYDDDLLRTIYSKAIPFLCSLALVFEIAICSENDAPLESISLDALEFAIANYDFIWEHTRKVYENGDEYATQGARLLAERLREGRVPVNSSTMVINNRQLYQKQWSYLNNANKVIAALEVLERYGHVVCVEEGKSAKFKLHPEYWCYYQKG